MTAIALLAAAAAAAAGLPPDGAPWQMLSDSPVWVECAEHEGATWCRSFGVVHAPLDQVVGALRDMRHNADKFASVVRIDVLAPDTLHVVLDFPSPLDDRDYVAQYTYTEAGGVHRFRWVPVPHQTPEQDGVVRLPAFAGEWRLESHPLGTAVRYTWHAEINGSFPSFGYGIARKKAGHEALLDLAGTRGVTLSRLDP